MSWIILAGFYLREILTLQEECIFLNHGAFGAVLKEVLHAAQVNVERMDVR